MKGTGQIGILVIAGLVVWWLTQRQRQAQAAELLPGETEPITKHVEREIPVYTTIERWEKANG